MTRLRSVAWALTAPTLVVASGALLGGLAALVLR